jgi:hypothetical protein
MTRRELFREFTLRLAACAVPTAILVGALFALGGRPAAIATLVFGGLAVVALATSVRSFRAAVIGGLLLATGLVAMLLFFAYVRST